MSKGKERKYREGVSKGRGIVRRSIDLRELTLKVYQETILKSPVLREAWKIERY